MSDNKTLVTGQQISEIQRVLTRKTAVALLIGGGDGHALLKRNKFYWCHIANSHNNNHQNQFIRIHVKTLNLFKNNC